MNMIPFSAASASSNDTSTSAFTGAVSAGVPADNHAVARANGSATFAANPTGLNPFPSTSSSLSPSPHTIRAVLFDLDGTLLDTLPHLTALTNFVLAHQHFPQHTQKEVLSYIGEGGHKLLTRAAPKDTSEQVIDQMFQQWKDSFYTHGVNLVAPFAGMSDVLANLKLRVRLGVLSNKFDAGCIASVQQHFPDTFCWVHGECDGVARKPQPDGLLDCLHDLQLQPDEALYVGDSVTDIDAACSARMHAIGVSWGYQNSQALLDHGACYLAKSPSDLLEYLLPLLCETRA